MLFGFPGWTQRTKPPKAPKCLNLPREMTLDDGQMRLAPVHEMATLRRGSVSGGALASGSQVEVRLSCGWAASGAVGVDVLVSTDGAQFTRVAYNYTAQQLVVDSDDLVARFDAGTERRRFRDGRKDDDRLVFEVDLDADASEAPLGVFVEQGELSGRHVGRVRVELRDDAFDGAFEDLVALHGVDIVVFREHQRPSHL